MTWPAPASVLRLRTHCHKGHEFDEANTVYGEDGNRRCLKCRRAYGREYQRRYYWKRKNAA